MGRVEGKVALITGAARGQGRSHAVKLAEQGADIIVVDACDAIESVAYPLPTPADLEETVRQVEQLGRRAIAYRTDIRDLKGLQDAVDDAVARMGRLDIVCANAGIVGSGTAWDLTSDEWQIMQDINLTGTWKTVKAVVPLMIERALGGSIILTSSVNGLIASPNVAHYVAAKHGVNGLMKVLAQELAPHGIRVNSINPTNVWTPMLNNDHFRMLFTGGDPNGTIADFAAAATTINALPIPWVDPIDVSNGVLYLASDEARYVTGTTLVIDAGAQSPTKLPDRRVVAP